MSQNIDIWEFDPCAPANVGQIAGAHDIMLIDQNLKDINPILCGQQMCAHNNSYGPKARDYYLLHYVVSGKGTFTSHGTTYNVSKGQIFIIRPGEMTFYKADSNDPWHYRWVGFRCSLDISLILHDDVINAPECEYIFRGLIDCDRMESFKEYYICGKIFEILALMSRNSTIQHNKSYEYALQAKNFIETNYNDSELTVAMLADKLNIERSYFSTLFKKHIGKSPLQYLLDCRMNRAAELVFSNLKLNEVAAACGYADVFNFSKMFKQKFGVSPRNYVKSSGTR